MEKCVHCGKPITVMLGGYVHVFGNGINLAPCSGRWLGTGLPDGPVAEPALGLIWINV